MKSDQWFRLPRVLPFPKTQGPLIEDVRPIRAGGKYARWIALPALLFVATGAIAQSRPLSWPAGWLSPLNSTAVRVNTNFGALSRGCVNANTSQVWTYYLEKGREQHLGLDLSASPGTEVKAIADGRILAVGQPWGAYWRDVMVVEHFDTKGQRFSAVYGHIITSKNPRTGANWRVGDVVGRGNTMGTVASIYDKIDPTRLISHLHFGVVPGESASIAGFSVHTGRENVDPCPDKFLNTTSPESFLGSRTASPLSGSIVGWKNSDGSVTSWLVQTRNGVLRRAWIPSTTVYSCLKRMGSVDRGPMPSTFLNQLPDQQGIHAACS